VIPEISESLGAFEALKFAAAIWARESTKNIISRHARQHEALRECLKADLDIRIMAGKA
jgi:hypothetical protein